MSPDRPDLDFLPALVTSIYELMPVDTRIGLVRGDLSSSEITAIRIRTMA